MGNKEMESQLANLKNEVKSLEETLVKKNAEIQEKEKEFHGRDDIIKGNEEIIQGKTKEIQGKDSIIKGLKETIQVKEETIRRKDKEIQEKDSIIKGLEEVILKYKEIEKDEEIKIQKEDSVTQEKDDETKIQDKDNVTQEKDDETKVQDKDNVIQEKGDETKIQDKDNVTQEKGDETKIQDKDNVTQEKDDETKQDKDNITQEKDDETKIQDWDNIEKDDETKIQDRDNITQEKDDETKIQDKDNVTQEKDDETKIQDKDNVIKEKDEETKIQEFAREIQEKEKIIKDLERDNNKLRNEAAKYQYALGTATSYRLSDNDKNNSVALKDDIIRLQNSLEEYITKCKGSIITDIDIRGVQDLLKKYGSQTIITIDQKALIKAVLKRHVIERIFECANGYFNNLNVRDIEVIMYKKGQNLVKLAKDFAEQRDGVDETTKALPIKLRQQICAALGNRGFNDTINKTKNYKIVHEFIRKHQYNLNKEINKYRKLNPEKKKEIKEIEDMAGDIIRKVVNLFWFRLLVQEPIADRFWFKNSDKIDPNTMEGKWEDNDIDNMVVDICYFPLIANNSTRQIYTHAKILHMHKNNSTNIDNSSESVSSKQTESKE